MKPYYSSAEVAQEQSYSLLHFEYSEHVILDLLNKIS